MNTRYTSAEQMTHDDFGIAFTGQTGEVVYDANTRQNVWATMTQQSFDTFGAGRLGLGHGQRYIRNAAGHLVADSSTL